MSSFYKCTVSFFLMVQLFNSHAQLGDYKYHIALKGSTGIIDSSTFKDVGLTMEWRFHQRWSLLYNLDVVKRSDGYRHIHGSAGALIGPPLILLGLVASSTTNSNNQFPTINYKGWGVIVGIVALLIPDGIAYHHNINYRWDISPYLNVLGVDLIRNPYTMKSNLKYAASFGCRTSYSFANHLTAGVFLESRKAAPTGFGIGGGFALGYAFNSKKSAR